MNLPEPEDSFTRLLRLENGRDKNCEGNQNIVILVMIVCVVFYGVCAGKHWVNRQKFPLKERSPLITFMIIFCNGLRTILFFVGCILNKQVVIQFPLMQNCQNCPKCEEPQKCSDSTQVQNWVILTFYFFFRLSEILLYLCRNLRISIAFNRNYKSRRLMDLFSSEFKLSMLSLLVAVLATVPIGVFPESAPFAFWFVKKDKHTDVKYEGMTSIALYIVGICLLQLLFLFCYFQARVVQKNYRVTTEVMLVLVMYFLFYNSMALSYSVLNFVDQDTFLCEFLGLVPVSLLVYEVLELLIFLIVIIFPMSQCGKGQILPPQIALYDYKHFLVDEQCFLIFYKYLEHVQKMFKERNENLNQGTEKIPQQQAPSVLTLYMDLKIRSQNQDALPMEEGDNQYEQLVNEYFLVEDDDINLQSCFPKPILNAIIDNNQPRPNLSQENFEDIYLYLGEFLNYFFQDFKKTKSYQYLRQQMIAHDEINERLYQLHMVANDH